MKTMDAKAWLQMEALFEVTKEDKPIIIDQSRLIAMLEGFAEYRVKIYSISDVGERSTGRITVSFFRKVYKQFIDGQISMTKMLELMTEQAHRTDVCVKCQRFG